MELTLKLANKINTKISHLFANPLLANLKGSNHDRLINNIKINAVYSILEDYT